jgi:hypothetical protein
MIGARERHSGEQGVNQIECPVRGRVLRKDGVGQGEVTQQTPAGDDQREATFCPDFPFRGASNDLAHGEAIVTCSGAGSGISGAGSSRARIAWTLGWA